MRISDWSSDVCSSDRCEVRSGVGDLGSAFVALRRQPRVGRFNARLSCRNVTLIAVEDRQRHRETSNQPDVACLTKLTDTNYQPWVHPDPPAPLTQPGIPDSAPGLAKHHTQHT